VSGIGECDPAIRPALFPVQCLSSTIQRFPLSPSPPGGHVCIVKHKKCRAMKTRFFLFITFTLLCLAQFANAQNTNLSAYASPETPNSRAAAKAVNRNASFPGLSKFLSGVLQYPELARKNCIEGPVVVEATIGVDGSVLAVNLIEGIGFGCDETVLALVSKMPKWEPAVANGKPVEQKVLIPVRFRLQ
jgi:protein TonB